LRRVVVTGFGIVSCLGNDPETVTHALRHRISGIRHIPEYVEVGLRSHVAGVPDISGLPPVDRKIRRFMGDAALYAYHAMRAAIADAGLSPEQVSALRTGLIVGSGVGSLYEHHLVVDTLRQRGIGKVIPYSVPRMMGSTTSACLSTAFGMRGTSYSMTSACATSAHCIGHGAELIQLGKQDIVFAGGAEEVCWTSTLPFDAMGALSTLRPDSSASRPYDKDRDGFVIAGGGGMLVLEEFEHARRRGAHIHAELFGYGACSDGADMVAPSGEGAVRAMQLALAEASASASASSSVDYINTHATSTQAGDISELVAIRDVFGTENMPLLSSTKGLTGHPIAASAVHEAIYSLLMMKHGFLTGCTHIDTPDPALQGFPVLMDNREQRIDSFMSNSFGFGGTNASLIFRRFYN
jgi:3-oxoacyl-[acyl-carrier-protein] synthase-1